MFRRFISLFVIIPIAVVLIVLSVANRQQVRLSADPFNSADPALAVEIPLFAALFIALIFGIVVGGVATWLTQGKHRKRARQKSREAQNWKTEAGREKTKAEEILSEAAGNHLALTDHSRAA